VPASAAGWENRKLWPQGGATTQPFVMAPLSFDAPPPQPLYGGVVPRTQKYNLRVRREALNPKLKSVAVNDERQARSPPEVLCTERCDESTGQ